MENSTNKHHSWLYNFLVQQLIVGIFFEFLYLLFILKQMWYKGAELPQNRRKNIYKALILLAIILFYFIGLISKLFE